MQKITTLFSLFKATLRMMSRKKKHTFLNIVGLTLGIATSILIGLYVQYEYTFDTSHTYADRIYRVNQSMIWGDWNEKMSTTGPNVALALKADVQEIEAITRVLKPEGFVVSSKSGEVTNSFLEEQLLVADLEFFQIFSYDLVDGDPQSALSSPNMVVITDEVAKKHFGNEPALGKVLYLKGTILESNDHKEPEAQPFTISGVISEAPNHSHIQFNMVVSSSSFKDIEQNESTWSWTAFTNYALIQENTDIEVLENRLQAIPIKYAGPTLSRLFGQSFDELHASNKSWNLYLQPLEDVYLGSEKMGNILGPLGNKTTIYSFSAIGILILVLCSINFMNLSTAQSSSRAREVGIRKILGAGRRSLVTRFLFEAIFLVTISTILAIVGTEVFIDSFNQLSGKPLDLSQQLSNPLILLVVVCFCCVLGLLAGSYPAFFLSSFKSLNSIKGTNKSGFQGKTVRNALVVFQFTITIALIIGAIFIKKQLNYVSQFDLGYDKEHIIQLHNIEHLNSDVQILKSSLNLNPAISLTGQSHQTPPNITRGELISASPDNENQLELSRMKIDETYFDLLNVKLIAGRKFEENKITDTHNGVILNASAVQALGWGTPDHYEQDSPIGKFIYNGRTKLQVIGVTDNFHFKSPKYKVGPLVVYHIDNKYLPDSGTNPSLLSIKLNANTIASYEDMTTLISSLKNEIYAIDPSFPFAYSFLDQEFENSFKREEQINNMMNAFTLMALIIACLGLYGLAIFSAEQRTKELSIRKVFGASVAQLMMIFSKDFAKLVILGILLATPIALYLINIWLGGFAYRTSIDLWVFVLAGGVGLLISWLTIAFQSLKVANRNPTETLRDE